MNPVTFDGWVELGEIGAGGQGKVYKVRKPSRTRDVDEKAKELIGAIQNAGTNAGTESYARLVAALQNLATDPPHDLGALKEFNIPATGEEAKKALHRLQGEVDALGKLDEPGILKLLCANVDQRWIVTEYHPHGTLAQHRERSKGDALTALKAFRPLVAAVAKLHHDGIVHRDIKPENIFVASDGRLVLGDFAAVGCSRKACFGHVESAEEEPTSCYAANSVHRIAF